MHDKMEDAKSKDRVGGQERHSTNQSCGALPGSVSARPCESLPWQPGRQAGAVEPRDAGGWARVLEKAPPVNLAAVSRWPLVGAVINSAHDRTETCVPHSVIWRSSTLMSALACFPLSASDWRICRSSASRREKGNRSDSL
jgi:hypothetical protein